MNSKKALKITAWIVAVIIASCVGKIEQTIADVNVRAHTFKFITPAQSDALKIPNACNLCHADRTTAWATEALKAWRDRSPWRMAQGAPPAAEAQAGPIVKQ